MSIETSSSCLSLGMFSVYYYSLTDSYYQIGKLLLFLFRSGLLHFWEGRRNLALMRLIFHQDTMVNGHLNLLIEIVLL